MKKPNKRDTINLLISAFLLLAFIVCSHFFSQFTSTLPVTVGAIITVLLYAVFGLLLFYATRVGEGKAVKRFSVVTLIVMVIPSLYIIIASLASGMPLHEQFVAQTPGTVSIVTALAALAFGYGIPYTFVSGFELAGEDDAEAEKVAESEVLEGGIEADLIDSTADTGSTEFAEETTEEVAEEKAEKTEE